MASISVSLSSEEEEEELEESLSDSAAEDHNARAMCYYVTGAQATT